MSTTWIVHKFGGTSVADAGRYRAVARILLPGRREGTRTAVVSAMSGVTDELLDAVASAARSDNVVSFRTARYDAQPMIVRGPGAGPEVTAAGVFSDLLRLATFLGAPQ
ncbi:MAG TPA: hypothetical protein VF588_06190 [Pyrinomonadaceae bacterium]|jgi:aspartokinase